MESSSWGDGCLRFMVATNFGPAAPSCKHTWCIPWWYDVAVWVHPSGMITCISVLSYWPSFS